MDEYHGWQPEKRITLKMARELHDKVSPATQVLRESVEQLERMKFSSRDSIFAEISHCYENMRRLVIGLHYEATNYTGRPAKSE